jgi:DNA-binding beta-propeller fold protein YncE
VRAAIRLGVLRRALAGLMLVAAGCSGTAGRPVAPIVTRVGSPTPVPSLNEPEGIAVGGSRVYVANSGNDLVTGFPANPSGATSESPTYEIAGLDELYGVAVDARGQVYASTFIGASGGSVYQGSVAIFGANEKQIALIAGSSTALDQPIAIALH